MIVLRSLPWAERPSIIATNTPWRSIASTGYRASLLGHILAAHPATASRFDYKDNAAQHAAISNPQSTMAPRRERLKPSYLLVRQPKKSLIIQAPCGA